MEEQEVDVVEADVTEEDYASDSENEAETEDGSEDNGTDSDRTYTQSEFDAGVKEARKEQDKRAKDRFKKAKDSTKEEVGSDERYERLNLKTEGVTDKKEQDIILDIASYKGVDAVEAMKLPAVKAELAEYRAKASVPPPSTRTNGGTSDSMEWHASQARKGIFPKDPEIKKALRKMKVFG